jgi:hypothetical protein
MSGLTIAQQGVEVVWEVGGRPVAKAHWSNWPETVRLMRLVASGQQARAGVRGLEFVAVEQDKIAILVLGRLLSHATRAGIKAIANATQGQAKKAEEADPRVAQRLAERGAILARSGAPFGLSSNPRIQAETAKHAINDRTLRMALPAPRNLQIHEPPSLCVGNVSKVERYLQCQSQLRQLSQLH